MYVIEMNFSTIYVDDYLMFSPSKGEKDAVYTSLKIDFKTEYDNK